MIEKWHTSTLFRSKRFIFQLWKSILLKYLLHLSAVLVHSRRRSQYQQNNARVSDVTEANADQKITTK